MLIIDTEHPHRSSHTMSSSCARRIKERGYSVEEYLAFIENMIELGFFNSEDWEMIRAQEWDMIGN